MTTAPSAAAWQPLRLRPAVWGLCALALLVAVAIPATDLWQVWHTPVVVQVQLDTNQPQLGHAVHVLVTLHRETADLAQNAPLHVTLDMHGMPMYLPTLRVPAQGAHYQASLPFTMSGMWQVALDLQLPAHAPWHGTLHVQVGSGGTTT